MQGFVLDEVGQTPSLQEFRQPEAMDNGAVVTVLAAGMNPVDQFMAQGGYGGGENLPRVVGLEGVGQLADGKRVYFNTLPPFGSFAEQAVAQADEVIELPEGLDDGIGVALGISGMAAWLPLVWKAKLQAGESVLILGATGVQGQIAVQAAKLLGAGHVVAAGRDTEVLEALKSKGADGIAVLEGDLAAAISDAAPDGGYQVVIDCLYGAPFAGLLKSETLQADSRVVVLGASAGGENTIGFRGLQAINGATISGYSSFNVPFADRQAAYLAMAQHVIDGKLSVDVKEYALANAAEAWKAQGSGPHQKLVIVP